VYNCLKSLQEVCRDRALCRSLRASRFLGKDLIVGTEQTRGAADGGQPHPACVPRATGLPRVGARHDPYGTSPIFLREPLLGMGLFCYSTSFLGTDFSNLCYGYNGLGLRFLRVATSARKGREGANPSSTHLPDMCKKDV
jgi:hypothetical protein